MFKHIGLLDVNKQNINIMNYRKTLSSYLPHKTDPANVAVALLAGLAVGAILGVLFAPNSGGETRYRLSDKAKDLANNAKDRFQSVKNRFGSSQNSSEAFNEPEPSKVNAGRTGNKKAGGAKPKTISVDQNGSIQGI